jgi:hypothetical protein
VAAGKEVKVEELVGAGRDLVRDDLGEREHEAKDDEELAVEGRDHELGNLAA